VVAYPPGGVSDETARRLAHFMSARLGMPVLVESRPGAGGMVALEWLSHAAPDGHTLAYCAISPLVFAPAARPTGKPAAFPLFGIVPVVSLMDTPVLVLAHPSFKPSTFAEMIAAARAAPGRLRWATSGHATVGHLVLAQVRAAAGVDIIHIPYKGGGQQLTDALGGQFELLSSNARLPVLPGVPTLAELGYPAANLVSTFGLFAPRGTPPAPLRVINAVVNEALHQPEFRSRLLDVSNLPTGGSAADFLARITREHDRALMAPAD
jgi:tripartite-type tricarboxylate transporter receptor subunit TctC